MKFLFSSAVPSVDFIASDFKEMSWNLSGASAFDVKSLSQDFPSAPLLRLDTLSPVRPSKLLIPIKVPPSEGMSTAALINS